MVRVFGTLWTTSAMVPDWIGQHQKYVSEVLRHHGVQRPEVRYDGRPVLDGTKAVAKKVRILEEAKPL